MTATFWKIRHPKAKRATRYRSMPRRSPRNVRPAARRAFV